MKKFFLSLVAAFVTATATHAQNTLVATLSHGDDITMYYGSYALRNAVNAAESGDIINLSGGAFQATGFYKAITIRGTGIDTDNPTYILNDFGVEIPSSDTNRFFMEGVRCSGKLYIGGSNSYPTFSKCCFYQIDDCGGSQVKNVLFTNCKITDRCVIYDSPITMQFINSYVACWVNTVEGSGSTFVNCVIANSDFDNIKWSQLNNCIMWSNGNSATLPSTSIARNCVILRGNSTSPTIYNSWRSSFAELFKDFTGTYSDSQTFELTEDAKTIFQGTDGTQVGLYGGIMPYTSTPPYPQITKMNVANKTTADGKLSVDIEVSATE